jgi:hypothetical protein
MEYGAFKPFQKFCISMYSQEQEEQGEFYLKKLGDGSSAKLK